MGSYYKSEKLYLTTKHKKEEAIGPAFMQVLSATPKKGIDLAPFFHCTITIQRKGED
ncbi:MAG: hypothetical protein ACLFR1_13295 [Spirochaetia bacterium]